MKMIQKCISGCLALLMLLAMVPVQALAAEVSWEELPGDAELPEVPKLPQQAVAGEPLDIHLSFTSQEDKTAEELYEAYAKQAFFPASSDSVGLNGVGAGRELSGDTRVIYDALKVLIERVANGERSSAVFTIGQPIEYDGENYPVDIITEFSGRSFTQKMFSRILNALLLDMPYELYWFDKVSGCELIGGFTNEYGYLAQLTFGFTVAEDYRDDDVYAADTDKTGAASNAAANARDIVASYAKASDYEKLLGYQNEIHDLVSYDFDAAEGMYFTEEIDPWQLISVFDGDDTTNVVCEGYAKAYMYLCDLTTFTEDIECYVVSGYMEGVAHMWNIVDISGGHYLVDTTNNDTGTVCENGGLFLAGGIGSPVDGYYVDGLFYYYEDALKNLWGTGLDSILTLRVSNYDPTGTEQDLIAAGVCGDNMVWTLDSEGLFSVIGTGAMYDYEDCDTPWMDYWEYITAVEISEGVTSIGEYAFSYFSNLTDVSIPASVASIGDAAFFACEKLPEVVIPEGVTAIGYVAFGHCYKLASVNIPSTVTIIDTRAFENCKDLKTITLPKKLEFIGDSAFDTCTSLTEITIPDQVTHIGNSAFFNCRSLKTATVPLSVTYVGRKAFDGCVSLTDIYYAGTEDQWNQIYHQEQGDPHLTATIHFRDLDTPAITKLENTAEGVKITWGAVDGAAQYRVYYKTTGGWTKITDTTDTSFVWTGAKSGTTYAFTVRCLNAAGNAFTSEANTTGWKHTYIAQPAISKLESTAEGVKITWGKVGGAERYRVYLKSGNSWNVIGNTTDTSFVYTGAEIGTTYTFTVRCFDAENKVGTSTYNTTGWSHKYNPVPRISALTSEAGGIKITWDPIKGVEKYRVYVKNASGGWTKLTDTTATEYVYTGAKLGETYTFTVRGITPDGKGYTTTYSNTGWSHKYYPSPVISKMESVANGVKITWKAVKGAERYRVYVKSGTGGWKNVGSTTGTSFTWTGAKSGTEYSFTVRCVDADNKNFTSNYNTTGWNHTYIGQPAISNLESIPEGVKITWGKVAGAERYRVYVKSGTGWKVLGNTTDNSIVWTGAQAGKTYTFTVRCYNADNTAGTSTYNTTGWKRKFYPTPVFSGMESTVDGVKLTWDAIKGVEKYRVYVKTGTGWKKLTDTAETSFVWADAVLGNVYTFTVRGITADGKGYTTTYSNTGWEHKYYPVPEISGLESTAEGISLSWKAIHGAERYRVYIKSGTSWKVIGTTDGTGFLYADAVAGETYTFTIRCVDAANKVTTSDYNKTGWSIQYAPSFPEAGSLVFVDTPVAGVPYKAAMVQANLGETLYFTGEMSGQYLATSTDPEAGVDVIVEEVEGGYHLYFCKNDVKTYIDIVPREDNPAKVSVRLVEDPSALFTWDAERKTMIAAVGEGTWYLGTYNEYSTIAPQDVSYIADVSQIGVSQFPVQLGTFVP